jgi:hypothetical protein
VDLPGEIARLPKESNPLLISVERPPLRGRSIQHVGIIRGNRLTGHSRSLPWPVNFMNHESGAAGGLSARAHAGASKLLEMH